MSDISLVEDQWASPAYLQLSTLPCSANQPSLASAQTTHRTTGSPRWSSVTKGQRPGPMNTVRPTQIAVGEPGPSPAGTTMDELVSLKSCSRRSTRRQTRASGRHGSRRAGTARGVLTAPAVLGGYMAGGGTRRPFSQVEGQWDARMTARPAGRGELRMSRRRGSTQVWQNPGSSDDLANQSYLIIHRHAER